MAGELAVSAEIIKAGWGELQIFGSSIVSKGRGK
jgi:hypothetical protein